MKFLQIFALMILSILPIMAQEPTHFLAAGVAHDPYETNKFASGWVSYDVQTSGNWYSVSTVNLQGPNSSLRTGFAYLLLSDNGIRLLGFTDAGLMTGTVGPGNTTTTKGAFSGGGALTYDLGRNVKFFKGKNVSAVFAVRELAVASVGAKPVFEFGFGKAW